MSLAPSRSPPPPDGAAPTRDDVDYDDPDVVYDDATARDALRLFVKRALDEHREGGNRARYYELLDATRASARGEDDGADPRRRAGHRGAPRRAVA